MKVMYFRDESCDKLYTLENVRGISFSMYLDKIICEDVNGVYTIIDLQNVWLILIEEG